MTTRISFIPTSNGVTVYLKGRQFNINKTQMVYDKVVAALKNGSDEQTVFKILNQESSVYNGKIEVKVVNGAVYCNGSLVHSVVASRIVDMQKEGWDLTPMILFLENLMRNPSKTAVDELYSFLEKGQMPITPDGCFMAYKVVDEDYYDLHTGTIDNSVGKICEMPRKEVDANRHNTCSRGLHFCSFDYIDEIAPSDGHIMLLKINPADVVSIPSDYNDSKGRCCRYEVVGEYEDYYKDKTPYFNSVVYGAKPQAQVSNTTPVEVYKVFVDGRFDSKYATYKEAKRYVITDALEGRGSAKIEDQNGKVLFSMENR